MRTILQIRKYKLSALIIALLLVFSVILPARIQAASVPSAPTGLYITVISSNQVSLNWVDTSTNEYGFQVERKMDNGSFSVIAALPANATYYTDPTLSSGHTYTYRVAAYIQEGKSTYTGEVVYTVVTPPSILHFTATAYSNQQINLSWAYSTWSYYTTVIERKIGFNGTWSTLATLPVGTTSYSDTSLQPNTMYSYRLKTILFTDVYTAYYPGGNTGISTYTRPMNPSNLQTQAISPNQVALSWKGVTDAIYYVIERKSNNDQSTFAQVATVAANTVTWTDTGLTPYVEYTYRVKAMVNGISSDYSNESSIITSYLYTPSYLQVFPASSNQLQLTWYDASRDESGYEIWRREGLQGQWVKIDTTESNSVFYIDNSVTPGVQYYYKVRAFISLRSIYSLFSNEASGKSMLLAAPDSLDYSVSSGQKVVLSWRDNDNNENGFIVEQKIGMDGQWRELASLPPNTITYTVGNIYSQETYYFRIKAYNLPYNTYTYSEELVVSFIVPEPPELKEIQAISSDSIRITWADHSSNETHFIVERRTAHSSYEKVGQVPPNTGSFTDHGLTPATQYYYRVRAENQAGSSTPSASLNASTKPTMYFSDVPKSHKSYTAIQDLVSRGVMKGITYSTFAPGQSITRGEFVSVLVNALDMQRTAIGVLADVSPSHPYYREIMTARLLGLFSPDENQRFYPEDALTLEEMSVMAVQAFRILESPLPVHPVSVLDVFKDSQELQPYAISSLAALQGEKLLPERSRILLRPQTPVTRAETAELVYRILQRLQR